MDPESESAHMLCGERARYGISIIVDVVVKKDFVNSEGITKHTSNLYLEYLSI